MNDQPCRPRRDAIEALVREIRGYQQVGSAVDVLYEWDARRFMEARELGHLEGLAEASARLGLEARQ